MNADMQAEVARLMLEYDPLNPAKTVIAAMQFAYQDAARVCRELHAGHYDHSQRKIGSNECAEAIEARAK